MIYTKKFSIGERVITLVAKVNEEKKKIHIAMAVKCPWDAIIPGRGVLIAGGRTMYKDDCIYVGTYQEGSPKKLAFDELLDMQLSILTNPYTYIPAIKRESEKLKNRTLKAEKAQRKWEIKFSEELAHATEKFMSDRNKALKNASIQTDKD